MNQSPDMEKLNSRQYAIHLITVIYLSEFSITWDDFLQFEFDFLSLDLGYKKEYLNAEKKNVLASVHHNAEVNSDKDCENPQL